MAKYLFQLRRGTRYVGENGATLLNPDGTPIRDDWATYTSLENHLDPQEGELVLEYEEVFYPETGQKGKRIPRLKIGDGVNVFADLEYMSVDSFILPKPVSITLYVDGWRQVTDENDNLVVDAYSQVVTVDNATITANSRIDLQPTLAQLTEFYDLGVVLTTENNNKVVTVYSVGVKPEKEYTIPATVTEIIAEGEVAIDG